MSTRCGCWHEGSVSVLWWCSQMLAGLASIEDLLLHFPKQLMSLVATCFSPYAQVIFDYISCLKMVSVWPNTAIFMAGVSAVLNCTAANLWHGFARLVRACSGLSYIDDYIWVFHLLRRRSEQNVYMKNKFILTIYYKCICKYFHLQVCIYGLYIPCRAPIIVQIL